MMAFYGSIQNIAPEILKGKLRFLLRVERGATCH